MSTKDKLLERFKSLPKDFTFEEFIHVFEYLGFEQNNKGTTSGSRVRLEKGETYEKGSDERCIWVFKEVKSVIEWVIYITKDM